MKKRRKATPEPKKPDPVKPSIPKDVWDKFLDQKMDAKDKKRIHQKECANVGRDHYRVNVWLEKYVEGQYYPEIWMGYSYYLHHKDGKIIDKTIYPDPKNDKLF